MEANYGGSRAYWFLALFTSVSLVLYLIGGLALIVNLVGFCYPAFASFKVRASRPLWGCSRCCCCCCCGLIVWLHVGLY